MALKFLAAVSKVWVYFRPLFWAVGGRFQSGKPCRLVLGIFLSAKFIFNFYLFIYLCLCSFLLQRKGKGETETQVWGKTGCLPYASQPGTDPATRACALTGDWSRDPSVYGIMLQPTEAHQSGLFLLLLIFIFSITVDIQYHVNFRCNWKFFLNYFVANFLLPGFSVLSSPIVPFSGHWISIF